MRHWHLLAGIGLLLAFVPSTRGDDQLAADSDIPKLIDRLVGTYVWDADDAEDLRDFLPLRPAPDDSSFWLDRSRYGEPAILRRLVGGGAAAIPYLLAHLDDQRLTGVRLPTSFFGGLDEEGLIDRNRRTDPPLLAAKPVRIDNTPQPRAYPVTVGDLCYVAIGQIVNREYYLETGGKTVAYHLPSLCPPIVARVRAAWKGMTPEKHRASLIADFRTPDSSFRRTGALIRLSYYYPNDLDNAVLSLLAAPSFNRRRVEELVHRKLNQVNDEKANRASFDAFVAKYGEAARKGIHEQLFDDLEKLEKAERERGMNTPQLDAQTRKLLVQLFAAKENVSSKDRPWFDLPSMNEQAYLIGEFLRHDRSPKIDLAALNLLRNASDDDYLAYYCMRRLIGRGYDSDIEAYCKRRIPKADESGCRLAFEEKLRQLGRTRLHLAAEQGDLNFVREDVRDRSLLSAIDRSGQAALHLAAAKGNLECVEVLVEAGAKVDLKDRAGLTPVQLAVRQGKLEVARFLINRGCGIPDLFVAAVAGRADRIRELASKDSKALDASSEYGPTPLQLAAWCNQLKSAEALLRAGAKVDETGQWRGPSPLKIAAAFGRDELLRRLLRYKPKLGPMPDELDHAPPIHWAVRNRHRNAIEIMLDAGTPVDVADDYSRTPLFVAVESDNPAAIDLLIRRGANVNSVGDEQQTVLLRAVRLNRIEAARRLLAANAKVDVRDGSESPLHVATEDGYLEMARLLLSYGADRNARNFQGKTPLDLARDAKNRAMIDLLEKE